MDAQNSLKDHEFGGDRQTSELPILSEKDNSQEASDHVRPLVSEAIRLQIFLLTIAVLSIATESRNKTYSGDQSLSTHLEGASRPRTRRSQIRHSSCSTCWTLSTPMGVMRVQAHRWQQARAGQSFFEGGWRTSEKRERLSSASPRQTAIPAALL